MLFSSLTFLLYFLPLVLIVYHILPNKGKNLFLLISSLFFYAWGEPVSRPTRVEALTAYLNENSGVPVIFPRETLRQSAEEQQVYYKYDTHWNDVGAWLAAQEIKAALEMAYESVPQIVAEPQSHAPTDLANMCGLWHYCTEDIAYSVKAGPEGAADLCTSEQGGEITGYTGHGTQSLLLVRDSFGEALAPYLADSFAKTVVLHGNQLNTENLRAQCAELPDVVVVEIGERYADSILHHVPILTDWTQG